MSLPCTQQPSMSAGIDHLDWLQLPVYAPNEEERQSPVLYAANVREYMVRSSLLLHRLLGCCAPSALRKACKAADGSVFTCAQLRYSGLRSSLSVLADKREYHAMLLREAGTATTDTNQKQK